MRLVCVLLFAAVVSALTPLSAFHLRSWKHRTEEFVKLHAEFAPRSLPPAQYYSQTLDHFNPLDGRRFGQRWWFNDTFFTPGTNAPVILYIQGEGTASPLDVVIGHHVELAAKYGALVIEVEHRFYGGSIPTPDLSTENLRFLSSQQALADLAEFIQYANQRFGLVAGVNRWFAFGGSYSGALTSWLRLKFPHLIYGGFASSGPVHAEFEFTQYNEVIAASLALPMIGGSDLCLSNVQSAFEAVQQMASTSNGLSTLSTMFTSCQPVTSTSSMDYYQFIANLAGIFQGSVQYNNDSPLNVSRICGIMTNAANTPINNLAALNIQNNIVSKQQCVDNSWADYISSLANTTADPNWVGVGARQWTWQSCVEFGYYQTCDQNTKCPFSSILTLQSFTDLCVELFNVTADFNQWRVNYSNTYYGSNNPDSTNVVFINGSVDPWHALSVLQDLGHNDTAIFIPGTSHCADLSPSTPNDSPAMRAAKQQIEKQFVQWISQ